MPISGAGAAGGFFSGKSVTRHSVVIRIPAAEAALSRGWPLHTAHM